MLFVAFVHNCMLGCMVLHMQCAMHVDDVLRLTFDADWTNNAMSSIECTGCMLACQNCRQ